MAWLWLAMIYDTCLQVQQVICAALSPLPSELETEATLTLNYITSSSSPSPYRFRMLKCL